MTALYDLPSNPTAADIVRRSIVAHPSLFRDALIGQAEQHDDYARFTNNTRAKQGAIASKRACLAAYDIIGDDDMSADDRAAAICDDTGQAVIALNVACNLQCLPPHVRTAAAASLAA